MAMGSTGTVNITPEMMRNAMSIIEEYRTQTGNLYTQLSEEVYRADSGEFQRECGRGIPVFLHG